MPDSNPALMTLFTEALERIDLAERAAYLDRACRGDADLRRRVEKLLAAKLDLGIGRSIEPERTIPREPFPPEATGTFNPEANLTISMAVGDRGADGATVAFGDAPPARAASSAALGSVIAGRYALVEPIGEGGMGSV